MSRSTRTALHVAAALLGAMAALTIVLSLRAAPAPGDDAPTVEDATESTEEELEDPTRIEGPTDGPVTVLAWTPGGFPSGVQEVLSDRPGITETTLVSTQLKWLTRSVGADGATLDQPEDGLSIPMEVALVDPSSFARFVAPSERQAVLSLRNGEILLARSSAELRRADIGSVFQFGTDRYDVVGELTDVSAGGYEAILRRPRVQKATRSYLLARGDGKDFKDKVRTSLERAFPNHPLRTRIKGETPFLRYGDAVPPQLTLKKAFGEFAARPMADGRIEIDPAWQRRNIQTYSIAGLGPLTCHRLLRSQLRSAFEGLGEQELPSVVEDDAGAGCYVPRFLNWDPTSFLSHHSWGVALDLNVAENPYGSEGSQNARLVRALEESGFTWGGRYLIPDPMHFEWSRFP